MMRNDVKELPEINKKDLADTPLGRMAEGKMTEGKMPEDMIPWPEDNIPKPGGEIPWPGGEIHRPGGEIRRPGDGIPWPGGEIPGPGDGIPWPGGEIHRPGGEIRRPGDGIPWPGGEIHRPGGEIHRPGGEIHRPEPDYRTPVWAVYEKYKHCPLDNKKEGNENNGHWEGERGDSVWRPNPEDKPQKNNPDGKTWGEILAKYKIDGIPFKDGEPDFSEIAKGTVEIEPFSDNRTENFDKADIELAKQKGCSPEDVKKWRKENGYTWHECRDMKTMQKVPSEVHNNIPHSGGIAEAKKEKGE